MRTILIGLALAFVALPASAETRAENIAQCQRFGRPDASIKACTALIQSGQETPATVSEVHDLRAAAFERKGDLKQAFADYTQAIAVAPDKMSAWLAYENRGGAYKREGRYDEAIADYDRALALDTQNGSTYSERAGAFEAKGLHDKAIADYTQAITLEPGYAYSYLGRAVSYEAERAYDRAIADCTKAIALLPFLPAPYNCRARAYHLKGEDAKGLPDADKAIAMAPNFADALETRAEIYEKLGRRRVAVVDYSAALKIDPSLDPAKAGLRRLAMAIPAQALSRPYTLANGRRIQLADKLIGRPTLSPDGRTVAFIRVIGQASDDAEPAPTEVVLMDTETGKQRILAPSGPRGAPDDIYVHSDARVTFSENGKELYIEADCPCDSHEILAVEVATGNERLLTHGIDVSVLRNGPWQGDLLMGVHTCYTNHPGCDYPVHVVRPDGKTIFVVPGTGGADREQALARWLSARRWRAW